MHYVPEPILNSNNLPGKLYLYKLVNISRHQHSEIELDFVLSGTVKIYSDHQMFTLAPTDILVINSSVMHELYADNAEMLSLEINLSDAPYFEKYKNFRFCCCSANDANTEKYDRLRCLLARLVKESGSDANDLNALSVTASIIHELVTNFQAPAFESIDPEKEEHLPLTQITDYLNLHYKENITLNELSRIFHFSQPYLSRLFRTHTGVTYSDYYNHIRLEHAANDLIAGNASVADIALDNGFPNVRSMTALFKKIYGVLPSEYRRQHATFIPQEKSLNDINYLAVTTSTTLAPLAQYLQPEYEPAVQTLMPQKFLDIGTVDTSQTSAHLSHTWRNVCCVGSARDLLFSDVRQMLRRVQQEFPFRYVIFHGIVSDDVMMYDELPDGTVTLSFSLFDNIVDFLLSIRLKPFFQISFMPAALASDPDKTSFFMHYNTSLPKDYDKWCYLITSLVQHCIERYSLPEVLSWPFSVWNEPDTPPEMFGFKEKKEFFRFYEITCKAVKSIEPRITFGTPSLIFLLEDELDWYHPFFDYCRAHDCVPEFLNIHFYGDDLKLVNDKPYGHIINRLTQNENSFSDYLDQLSADLESYGIKDIPVYMTEWNLTVNQRNLINDTCFKACYLTKNLLENYDRLLSLSYWSLTDMVGELQPSDHLFHGGLGMFTKNGIPKSHYYAFKMISNLGDEKISSGKGWFLTRGSDQSSLQLMLYNYTHYDKLFSTGELFDMTMTNRYTSFSNMKSCTVSVTLTNLCFAECQIRETFINRDFGSSYDAWVRMGGIDPVCAEDIDYLHCQSRPGRTLRTAECHDGTLTYTRTLAPLEVCLVEIIALRQSSKPSARSSRFPAC